MNKALYWSVKAFFFRDGKYELQEFATGMAYDQARSYYWSLYDSNKFAMLKMTRLDQNQIWTIENKEAA
jgi:hypothetical protein